MNDSITSKKRGGKRRKLSPEKIERAKAQRAELAALSRAIKLGMEMGQFPNCERVNDALLEIYTKQTGQSDFRRFREWKDDGYSVRKGESAFRVWAKPRKRAKKSDAPTAAGGGEAKDEFSWFPICCLFHAGQVESADGKPPVSFVLPIFRPMPLALPAPSDAVNEGATA